MALKTNLNFTVTAKAGIALVCFCFDNWNTD